jgi:hypothetical protein
VFRNIFNKGGSKESKGEPKPVTRPGKVTESRPAAKPKPAAKSNSVVAMVPIFSWRTVLVAAIGLILGVLISLGYWIISPTLGSSSVTTSSTGADSSGSGLVGLLGLEPQGPYDSKVRIQVVSPGSEYIPLKNLQQMGEYYGAKAGSLPFLQFLEKKLSQQMPGSSYDVDDLNRMITTQYDYTSELPAIKVTVIADTEGEAIGLAELIPQDFREYLSAEEMVQRQKEYDNTLKEIENIKTALYQAQQELNTLQLNDVLNTDPNYISLKAKVDTLQQLLDAQVIVLADKVVNDTDVQTQYDMAIQQMTTVGYELERANQELESLQNLQADENSTNEVTIITLNAKIKALQGELDKLMVGYTQVVGTTTVNVAGLAQMIANGDTSSTEYFALSDKVNTLSLALANAQKELDNLVKQSTEVQVSDSLNYQIALIRVDTLNVEMSALKDEVRQLYQQIIDEQRGAPQQDPQSVLVKISEALAEAKKNLENLEIQLGYDRLAVDMDYTIAQDKVTNLTGRLGDLTDQLGALIGGGDELSETDYLVAGNPSTPSPILPERGRARNTLLMGAIAGMVIAWGILNYKWIIKGMPSSSPGKPEGDGEK